MVMRLNKIKLAGFKSFVDPTTINLISNLSGVVGPNGCGKSNVIDAVRWVMGESSAKYLRGGSLTDVIFSGSTTRKPVGQATVELLFDNTDGTLGGEYASYAEIAIKRQVTRDGQSNYFLNGQRCRRRDITDIFLGTGLGPRSYAIIEQGMISRVIEAKPEDLRVFLEEAAGISKYKERRRETENRIQHTQDNLARLNDLRGELEKQLRHLDKQAQAAERYQALKTQEQEMGMQLAALAWQRLDQEIKLSEQQLRQGLTQLEAEQASFQHFKTEQEKHRYLQTDLNETLNEVQKRYYAVGAQIAKIEQTIQHHHERQQQLNNDKKEAEQTLLATQAQLDRDQETTVTLKLRVEELEPQYELAAQEAEKAGDTQQLHDAALEKWRETLAQIQQATLEPTRQAEAEKAKISQLERQIQQTQDRQNRLETELSQLNQLDESTDLAPLTEKIEMLSEQAQENQLRLEDAANEKEQAAQNLQNIRPVIKDLEQRLNIQQGQEAALCALQATALGKDDAARQAWIAQSTGVQGYLAEKIVVTKGWENAVEMVLGGFLEAVGIAENHLLSLAPSLGVLEDSGISLIEWHAKNNLSHSTNVTKTLITCIQGSECLPESLRELLAKVHICGSQAEALAQVTQLSNSESVITPNGYWMGPGWIKVKAKEATEASVLLREEKRKVLAEQIAIDQAQLIILKDQLEANEEKLTQVETAKECCQQEKNRLHQELVTIQSEYKIKQNRIEQQQKRLLQLRQEVNENKETIHAASLEVTAARGNLHAAVEKMSEYNEEQQSLLANKNALHEEVNAARIRVKESQAQINRMTLDLQTYRTQINSLQENIDRSTVQIENMQNRVNNIVLSLAKNEDPIAELKIDLEGQLEASMLIEDELSAARDDVAATDNLLRELDQKTNSQEQKISAFREQLEQIKLNWQALSVRRESILEKLKNIETPIADILANTPPEANEKLWQQQIIEIEQKIQRLGAINLAAIEEFKAAAERKEYLDAQCQDLQEALTTLENAIKKIDKETRLKFQETFDKVNSEFTQLFPKLFGGGQASLVLTGEDLLNTGISVIARPPGKKNSTIQLLSGGEKALTAIALVFSIFQLNPAPFCMLDEVDAPLDDSNVGRFCNLVKEMSKKIQFIYISHNKLAIEMADQLQGVTMREPGVSRLVTVDIEEAKSLALA